MADNMTELQTNDFDKSKYKKHKIGMVCRICGAKAIGFNYNGLACESCRTFFRRNSYKPNKFQCFKGNKCKITQFNRKTCKRCRIDRCYAIGMKKELIWKCKYKEEFQEFLDKIKEENKTLHVKHNLTLNQYEWQLLNEIHLSIANIPEERSLPVFGLVKLGKEHPIYPSMYIKKFVKYCKSLSSFKVLNKDDQLALVKEAYVPTLSIRFAFYYNPEIGQFPIMANQEGTGAMLMDNVELLSNKDKTIDPIRFIKFRQSLNFLMEDDLIIRNLIIIQFLFANRNENLQNCEYIRHQYYFYCTLLLRYYEHKHQCTMLAKQKYFTLMQALGAMDYQVEKIREMFTLNVDMAKRDAVHREIFDLRFDDIVQS